MVFYKFIKTGSKSIDMINKFEIAENPNILLNKDFDYKMVELEGNKLNGDYNNINILDVTEVHVEDYKEKYSNFTKKIEQFENYNGWIHMSGEFSFGIYNQKINQISLRGKYIETLMEYNEKDIIKVYGNPDKILKSVDCFVNARIFVYSNNKLYIFIDIDSNKIREIQIGNVNEEFYHS